MKYRYLFPFKMGITVGFLVGAASGARILLVQRYVHFHLFNMAARSVALQIDKWVLEGICLFYLVHMILMVYSRFGHRKRNHAAAVPAVLVSAFCVMVTYGAAQAGDAGSADLSLIDLILRPVLGFACIVMGLVVMRRLRQTGISVIASAAARVSLAVRETTYRSVCVLFVPCLVAVLAVNAAAAVLHARAARSVHRQPNIIFIMVDTLRADHLGCYGYRGGTSPNIDRFASEAIRFDRAISQSSATIWSVPSFMTSQYPQDISIATTSLRLDHGPAMLAEVLKDCGYSTSAVISNPMVGRPSNFAQGYDHFDESSALLTESSPLVFARARDEMKRLKDQRFFMFLLFMDPHTPYVFHTRASEARRPEIRLQFLDEVPDTGRTRTLRTYYDSEIGFTDRYIGMLMQELKRQGLYDNSLIIFLGDHGEEFGEHGHVFHGRTLFNEVLSVPLIMKLPHQREGRVVKGTARLLDVVPTLMQMLGRKSPALSLQGSAMDLESLERLDDRPIYSAVRWNNQDLRAATTEKYKFILNMERNEEMLFDTQHDPGEVYDISRKEPDVSASLHRSIVHRDEVGKSLDTYGLGGGKEADLSKQEKDRLKSLGYLGN